MHECVYIKESIRKNGALPFYVQFFYSQTLNFIFPQKYRFTALPITIIYFLKTVHRFRAYIKFDIKSD